MGKNATKRQRRKLSEKEARALTPSAQLRHLRMSPRKVRLVADLIRGKKVEEAAALLDFVDRAAAKPLAKMLRSAAANGENNNDLDIDDLYVRSVQVDEGPTARRYMPRAMGRATRINKRTSHVKLILGQAE